VVQAEGWIVGEPAGEHFTAIAIPAGSRLLKPEIVSGRWLQPGDTNAIVLNTALAAKSPPSSWRVVGIAREPFSPAVGYVSREYLEQRSGHIGMANSVRLVLDRSDPASINAVKASLDRNLELAGLRALASSSKADSRYGFDQHMLMIYVFLIVISCILGGVGGLGLMTTMSLNVLERRREMGVLRAIGASPRMVWLIVAAEGVVVGVLSWALATLAAWPLSKFLGNALVNLMFQGGLDFWFEPLGVFVWLAVSIALGLAASFLPAWHASRVTVREALAHV